jgi:hypothetical protein
LAASLEDTEYPQVAATAKRDIDEAKKRNATKESNNSLPPEIITSKPHMQEVDRIHQITTELSALLVETRSTIESFEVESKKIVNIFAQRSQEVKELRAKTSRLGERVVTYKIKQIAQSIDLKTQEPLKRMDAILALCEQSTPIIMEKAHELSELRFLANENVKEVKELIVLLAICNAIVSIVVVCLEVITNNIVKNAVVETLAINSLVVTNRKLIEWGKNTIKSFAKASEKLQGLLSAQVSDQIS